MRPSNGCTALWSQSVNAIVVGSTDNVELLIACVSFLELISHWCLTRFTDSSFKGDVCPPEITVTYPQRVHPTVSGSDTKLDVTATRNHSITEFFNLGTSLDFNAKSSAVPGVAASSQGLNQENGRRRTYKSDNIVDSSEIPNKLDESNHTRATEGPKDASVKDWDIWSYCRTCCSFSPPRCHHCPLCNKCILKRHHHCFFTGVCIGAANERHFIAFMFWGMFVTVYGTAHMLPYAFGHLINSGQATHWDLIPFVVLYRIVFGYTHPTMFVLCLTFWCVNAFTVLAVTVFYRTAKLTVLGLTETEYLKNVNIVDSRRLPERLRHIMGENWVYNFILPFRRDTLLKEDAVNWPCIKRFSR
ncbi:palmitoyltransferase [Plakobranchus ocellatus]|uniref:Palmitoyltransferase n=1 Tax=Plakobranchus ocellatus TaxID=259542 RepID=A0AAV4AC61_9GAST|nr:palmitoyltransferase [Plakobranchus ocellatus]